MKRFLSKLGIFMALAFMGAVILLFLESLIIEKNARFKLPDNVDKLVVGHSHAGCAFNDSLIADVANISDSGEVYGYSYFKLKEILDQNKNIKAVFIGFSNNQITKEMDSQFWDDKHITHMYPVYGPFMDYGSNAILLKNNPEGLIRSLSLFGRNGLQTIFKKDFDYTKRIEGYRYLDKSKINPKKIKELKESNYQFSKYNLYYLNKIIEECRKRNIKTYLVRTPLHSKYWGLNNEKFFQKTIGSNFSEIDFFDFKDFPLNDSEFADVQHLNYRGAEKFSKFFNKLIENGLLEKTDKQEFIEQEMTKVGLTE